MKQIRNSVFETNSSSSHVLTIEEGWPTGDDAIERKLPGDYLLELTDEFSEMFFTADTFNHKNGNREQAIEQKLQYMYVYCVKNQYMKGLFEAVVYKIALKSGVTIDFKPEDEASTRYYNKAWDYLVENNFYINHESSDHLDELFEKCETDEDKAQLIYDIITNPQYIIEDDNKSLL